MKLSKAQQGQYWRLFNQATTNLHMDRYKGEEYRHQVLFEEAGVVHIGDLGTTGAYEKVMARMAVDAGDYELACRYATGDARRYRHMILDRAREILEATAAAGRSDERTPEAYVAGVMFQGRLVHRPYDTPATFGRRLAEESAWEDIPAATLRLVLQILSSELAKLRKGSRERVG